jgi:biotin operon repressor
MSRLEVAVVVSLRNSGRYLTGEELGRLCGASPGKVRAAVLDLVKRGYGIDEVPGEGFRLRETASTLDGADIRASLSTKILGSEIFAFGRIGSTNDVATALARGGAPDGSIVIAEEQTRGRGRLGRRWHSPPSAGLWFTCPEAGPFRRSVDHAVPGGGPGRRHRPQRTVRNTCANQVAQRCTRPWPEDLWDSHRGGIPRRRAEFRRRGDRHQRAWVGGGLPA